jgi:hypothetical protein
MSDKNPKSQQTALKLLATSRDARREAAIAKLATARRQCAMAEAARQHAAHEVSQAQQWQAEVQARCTLGEGQALRESLLPACAALLQQRQQQLAHKQMEWQKAQAEVDAQRQHLTACERDSLRLQEWQQLQQAQTRRDQAAQENQQDEEMPLHATYQRGAA